MMVELFWAVAIEARQTLKSRTRRMIMDLPWQISPPTLLVNLRIELCVSIFSLTHFVNAKRLVRAGFGEAGLGPGVASAVPAHDLVAPNRLGTANATTPVRFLEGDKLQMRQRKSTRERRNHRGTYRNTILVNDTTELVSFSND